MYDNDRRDDNHKHESDWLLHEVHNVTQPRNRKQNFPNYVFLWSLCAVLGIVCITLRLIYNASFNRLHLCYTVSGWYICLGVLPKCDNVANFVARLWFNDYNTTRMNCRFHGTRQDR